MRAIVHAFKYRAHQSLAARLAGALAQHPHLALTGVDLVVPVPLHPWRRVSRGFNQAERLARHLGPPVVHALARRQWTPPQAVLGAGARQGNMHGAFAIRRGLSWTPVAHDVRGARVLLVDDVVTTGATLSACAMVLREAGARSVRAATIARTERGWRTEEGGRR